MHKLLACTALAAIGLISSPAFASETDDRRAPRCRVGNGKSATYHADVNECTKARAAGRTVEMIAPAPPPAKPAPTPAPRHGRQARRGSR